VKKSSEIREELLWRPSSESCPEV